MKENKDRLANLSPEKRSLLAKRLKKSVGDAASTTLELPQLIPDLEHRYESYPMFDLQQAYWIGRTTAFEMGSIASKAYVELDCVDLDIDRLNNACQMLINRHDMLRLVITKDGQQQVLENTPEYKVETNDIQSKSESEQHDFLVNVQEQMLGDTRDASDWPLFDIRASIIGNSHTHLHFCFDLLNLDAGSISILFNELTQLYSDPGTTLSPINITFRDYVNSINDIQKTDLYKKSRDYWTKRIPDFPVGPELPLAKSPNDIAKPKFVRLRKVVDTNTWSNLKERSKNYGITSSSLLLAVFAEILARWSRKSRLVINIPLFNRYPIHNEVENIIGAFTSVNLLAVDHSKPESFLERAKRVQIQLINDLDHRYFDGVQVMREIARVKKSRAAASMPIVFTSLIEQSFDEAFAKLGKIDTSINQTAQVWMDLHVDEHDGALIVKWDAVDELFPDGLVKDMLDAYCCLIEQLASDSFAWEGTERQLMPQGQIDLRNKNNETDKTFPNEVLQSLIDKQASEHADKAAVISPGRTLTYDELSRLSNKIGRILQDAGTHPNALVAIIMDKGWEQIVAVLGIMKSGAAYLPIDPEFPASRINYLLEHGQVNLVLTQSWVNENLDVPNNIIRFCVDTDQWEDADDSPLEPIQTPDDLAYVLYTSGSTGLPKGVMIKHSNVVNRMLDINERFDVGLNDRVIALTALPHDLSVYDVFGTLIAGATIVIPDAQLRIDPAHLADLMVRENVTVWNSVPAYLEMLVDYIENTPKQNEVIPRKLKFVILAGDWIPVNLPDRLMKLVPTVNFVASGGPTETTIWDIYNPIKKVDSTWKSIPYGRPLTNAHYYILNDAMEPCPDWVVGEMYIGGAGLGLGYWRDEERTNKSFIVHPQTGERLYRSGDLGRFLPDGNIEFIGRADFQVKIRGYRIELGEIESALLQNELVRDVAVITLGESQTDKKLVAYIVAGKKNEKSAESTKEEVGDNDKKDDGIIRDPIERAEFKLKRLGLRHDAAERKAIDLKSPDDTETLRDKFLSRQSYRSYLDEEISNEEFSNLIGCLRQVQFEELPIPKMLYPSGGGLYPVQTYLYIKPNRIEGVPGGTYYYDPDEHKLITLKEGVEFDQHSIQTRNNHPLADNSAFTIFHVAQENAITPLYGKNIRDFYFLEAGYMGQLLMMEAPKYHIGLCTIGGTKFDSARDLFDLDEGHVYLHCMYGGKINDEQMRSFTLLEESKQASSQPLKKKTIETYDLTVETLRTFLLDKLPKYMVPSVFVFMDALPLTPNGKLNRAALPEPFGDMSATNEYVPPDTPAEKLLADVWKNILKIEEIGIHDNFMDLGGHSLAAVQVISQVERKTGIRLSPRSMVSDALEQMAKEVEEQWSPPKSEIDTVEKQVSEGLVSKIVGKFSRSK